MQEIYGLFLPAVPKNVENRVAKGDHFSKVITVK